MERADTKKATTLNDVPTWRDYSRVKMKGQGDVKTDQAPPRNDFLMPFY